MEVVHDSALKLAVKNSKTTAEALRSPGLRRLWEAVVAKHTRADAGGEEDKQAGKEDEDAAKEGDEDNMEFTFLAGTAGRQEPQT